MKIFNLAAARALAAQEPNQNVCLDFHWSPRRHIARQSIASRLFKRN
jgi:hypothetical protein